MNVGLNHERNNDRVEHVQLPCYDYFTILSFIKSWWSVILTPFLTRFHWSTSDCLDLIHSSDVVASQMYRKYKPTAGLKCTCNCYVYHTCFNILFFHHLLEPVQNGGSKVGDNVTIVWHVKWEDQTVGELPCHLNPYLTDSRVVL